MKKLLSIIICLSLVLSLIPAVQAADSYWVQTFTGYDGSTAPTGFSTGAPVAGVDIYGTSGLFGKTTSDIAFTHEINATGEEAPSGWETYPQWNMDTSLKINQFGSADIFCWGFELALNSYYGDMDIRFDVQNADNTRKSFQLLYMKATQNGQMTCMGQTVTSSIPLNTWVDFDFVFRTFDNTIDVYYNGNKVINKLDLSSTIATSTTRKVNFFRMFIYTAKVNNEYVNSIKYLDNFYANVVTEEPTITIDKAVSGSDKITVDEASKTITTSESLSADEFKSLFTLSDGASVEAYDEQGAVQTETLTSGTVYIKSASGKYSYYALNAYSVPDTEKKYPLSVSTNGDSIILTADGNGVDVGSSKTDSFEIGKSVTLKAVCSSEDKTFMYWKNESGDILSTSEEFTFITGSAASLSAVYADKTLGGFVTFKNANGKILLAGQSGSSLTVPADPFIMGYTFNGWYTASVLSNLKAGDTLNILESDTVFNAGFKKSQTAYSIEVNGISNEYSYNESVTVTAEDTDASGNPFMYWTKDSAIVSFDKEYKFYVSSDCTLTAVYGTSSTQSDIITVLSKPVTVARNKLAFFAEFDLPAKYSVIEMGILLNQMGGLSLDNYTHKAVSTSKSNKHQFTVRKANLNSGETWYGMAYVIYSDEEGNILTNYSNESSETLIIIDPITALSINTPSNLEQNESARQQVNFTVTTTPASDVDASTIEWYVNDNLQTNTSAVNTEFSYTPPTAGTYEIYAKVKDTAVASELRTIYVTEAEASDVVVLNEQFNYTNGYDFALSKPDIWSHLNITGSAEAKATASIKVAADPENPENMILEQLAPNSTYESIRLEKTLSEGLTLPIVVTGLAKINHNEAADPTFSIRLQSGSSGYKQLLQYDSRADGRIVGTNGIAGYITNDDWVRYTVLIKVNTTDLTQSKAKFMFSGNGNVSKTNGGSGSFITTDEYTTDLSSVVSIDTVAPTFRFSYGYGSPLGARYNGYYDDLRIYYPGVLKATAEKTENVFVDEEIGIKFNHNVDPLTLTDENIVLKNSVTGKEVSKKIEFDSLSVYGVKIIPDSDLDYNTKYTVEFTSGVTDIAGLSVSAPVSFTTQAEPDENSIRLNKQAISIYEDETDNTVAVYLNAAPADEASYTVESDDTSVADWSNGNVIAGIPGTAVLSFISADKTSKTELTVTVTEKPRASDYVTTVSIPSETANGDTLVYMTNGILNTDWTTAAGSASVENDTVIGGDVMTVSSDSAYSANVFLQASSKYVLEAKMLVSGEGGLSSNIGSLFKISDLSVYTGASTASNLKLDDNTWYHLKAIFTTDENFRVNEIRYFIDDTEVYQEAQAYATEQISSVGVYSNSGESRIDSLYFYKTEANEIASFAIPSETVEGDIIYSNCGTDEIWDYISGTPSQVAYEYEPSTDILNTVAVIKNASRASTLSKYLDLEGDSTYIYETKMKLSDGADSFKIKLGKMPLMTVKANSENSKSILLGNSTDANGYTLPTDTWFVFKAVINLDDGENVSAVSYYINSTEVYQEGQEPVFPYTAADRLSYVNENISNGEAVRFDDTYIYKTLWLTGVTADIFELQVADEEFNSAAQITRPGEAEMVLTINNGTRLAAQPKIVVNYYDETSTLISSEAQDVEAEIAAGESTKLNMTLNVPDGIAGGIMTVNVYDSTGTEQLTQPIEKTLNTGGILFLESIYGDNSILQRDMPINISGIAPTGSTVTVEFAGTSASAVAENNRFTVILPAQEASFENRTLTVSATSDDFSETKTVNNVQVGDVYYASGQSNMDWRMSNTPYGDHTIPENVRYIKIAYTTTADQRVDRHTDKGAALNENWSELNDSTINGCASVMFFMAQKIRNSGVDVPIGIIDCSLGGTSISAWVGEDVFATEEAYSTYYSQYLDGNKNIGSLYNFMFSPISSYQFKAMVWYQGEQDFSSQYEKLLPPMVESYRNKVGRDFPIMVVQLPGLNHVYRDIRFRQAYAVSTLDNAYLIVTNDTGHATDVHPANKDVVGDRLARVALNKLYGMDIAYSGPALNSVTIDGSSVTLELDYVSDGIHGSLCSMNDDSSLPGFELAGSDGKFYAAEAVIDGDTVKLTSESVSEPVYVRYGYVGEIFTSLGNDTDGYKLPMGCFRTDGKF